MLVTKQQTLDYHFGARPGKLKSHQPSLAKFNATSSL
jgi:hypothetical protein